MVKKVEIGEVCDVQGGYAFKSQDFKTEGIPLLKIANINKENEIDFSNNNSYVEEEYYEKYEKFQLLKGDIVVALSGATTGKFGVYLSEERVLLNQRVARLRANTDLIIPQYLYYYMTLLEQRIYLNAQGAAQPNISTAELAKFKIPLPNKEIQEKIVKLLNTAKTIINKRQSQLATLEELVLSMFLDMFGDPGLENRYQKLSLADVITSKPNNGIFVKNDMYLNEGNAEVIWLSDFIDKNVADLTNLKKITVDTSNLEKFKVSYGDLLFCRSSLTAKGIGKCSYIPNYDIDRNVLFECHIIKLSLNTDLVIPEFVQTLTRLDFFRNQINRNSKTATMTTISQDGITSCSIICPPIEEQLLFKQKLELINVNIISLENALEEMYSLYNNTLQKAFKGELFQDQA